MEQLLKIGDKEYKIKASAATLVHYRNEFGRDMLTEISQYAKGNFNTSVIECSVYIMAKDAGEELPSFDEWLGEFPLNAFSNAAMDVVTFWNASIETTVKAKKKADQPTGK